MIVSASGALWFPDFLAYAKEHPMKRVPEKLYLSIGDKETKTRHPLLKTVEDNILKTENIKGLSHP